jgi:hemolysin activation/secretion protein
MRYSIPLADFKNYHHQVSAGFDFKRSNNNLLSGGTNVLGSSDVDVAQFVLGYSGAESDRHGSTSFGLEAYYSPGGLTGNNNDASFDQLRSQTKAQYFYGRLNAERIEGLPFGFAWVIKGWAQIASDRLAPSEELGVGGYDSVRGYDERAANGDQGWIIRNELRTPPWSPGWKSGKVSLSNLTGGENTRDQLQFLAFFDYGAVRLINVEATDFTGRQSPNVNLYSVGAGLRYTVSRNFSLRFDYGCPLANSRLDGFHQGPRGHIGMLLSF